MVTFKFLTAVSLRMQVFGDVALCRWVCGARRFEGTYCLNIYSSWTACTMKMKAVVSFETSDTTHPTTQRYIPEDLHPHS
jgi:hypothetical protein